MLALLGSSPGLAHAEDAALHHVQSGALLAYAEAEVKILYAAIAAKEFDPELTKAILKELERTINGAKKSVDRTLSLLTSEDSKGEPELQRFRDLVKGAETQLGKLTTDVEEQTAPEEEAKSGPREGEEDEGKEPIKRDWELLKTGTGWLYVDLLACLEAQARLIKKLDVKPLAAPPKPRAKRE